MANVYSDEFGTKRMHFAEYGNAIKDYFKANKTLASADKLYFGTIPAGVTVTEMDLIHDADSDGTLSLGYEPVDSAMGPTAAATYWFNAQALSSAGRKTSAAKPVTFQYAVKLVGTVGGGAVPSTVDLIAVMGGRMDGFK